MMGEIKEVYINGNAILQTQGRGGGEDGKKGTKVKESSVGFQHWGARHHD